MVWNRERILFTRTKDIKIIDSIPLSEITGITLSTEKKFKLKVTEEEKPRGVGCNKTTSFSGSSASVGRKVDRKEKNVSASEITTMDIQNAEITGRPMICAEDNSSANVPEANAADQDLARMSDQKSKSCGNDSEILHIKTKTDGFNSGRTYCLRTDRTGTCQNISADLMRKARAARIREEKLTRFQKNQMQMSKLYNSTPFQVSVSVLILAVRALSEHTRVGPVLFISAR